MVQTVWRLSQQRSTFPKTWDGFRPRVRKGATQVHLNSEADVRAMSMTMGVRYFPPTVFAILTSSCCLQGLNELE